MGSESRERNDTHGGGENKDITSCLLRRIFPQIVCDSREKNLVRAPEVQ